MRNNIDHNYLIFICNINPIWSGVRMRNNIDHDYLIFICLVPIFSGVKNINNIEQ